MPWVLGWCVVRGGGEEGVCRLCPGRQGVGLG